MEALTIATLAFMKKESQHFSIHQLLETLFTSTHPTLKQRAGIFHSNGGALAMMKIWWQFAPQSEQEAMKEWIIKMAAKWCNDEASQLSDCGSRGPYYEDSKFLHILSTSVNVDLVKSFCISKLTEQYDWTTPHLQHLKLFGGVIWQGLFRHDWHADLEWKGWNSKG